MVKKLTLLFLGIFVFGALLLAAWYRIDGIPTEESSRYLSGEGYSSVVEENGSLVFYPDASNGHGIVMMHGALIYPQSYAKSAAYFAQLGYTVFLPSGPGRMSIAAIDSTAERLNEFGIAKWFFIGHSMGGLSSFETISRHDINAQAVALWATAMPNDYSMLDVPVLFIWGDNDGLLPAPRFRKAQDNLPKQTKYITLKGGNHKNFALYTHQFFDREATVDWMEQIDFANENTAAFFAEYL
jgi:pimeloyl-ACP methyl ester carboxylesterase